MNFLADENIEYSIISFLIKRKINVFAVRELIKGSSDAEIIEFAASKNLIIITSDKDFGELSFRLHKSNYGIILLRLQYLTPEEKANLLILSLKKLGSNIAGKFIVIEQDSIRIREL